MRTTFMGIVFVFAVGCSSSVSKPSTAPSPQPAPAKGEQSSACSFATCGGNGTQVRGTTGESVVVIDGATLPTREASRTR